MDDKLEIRRIGNIDVYFRKPFEPLTAKSQPEELELMIKHLTGEEFENYDGKYKRKLEHPENFEIIDKYKEDDDDVFKYICICSEDTCKHLIIIKYIPTDIYFTVGSICYLRFNEENTTELYYKIKAKKCYDCNNPLVFKECRYKKNTDKKCEGRCYGCFKKDIEEFREMNRQYQEKKAKAIEEFDRHEEEDRIRREMAKRIYLYVKYDDKDDAKSLGAKWDIENKRWYSPHRGFTELLQKYKPYPLKIL